MMASYSRQIVCSCSENQSLSRDRHVLHRQPEDVLRIGCHAGTCKHQYSGDGAAHSTGREQLAQRFSTG